MRICCHLAVALLLAAASWSAEADSLRITLLKSRIDELDKAIMELQGKLQGDVFTEPAALTGPQRAEIQRQLDGLAEQQKQPRAELTALRERSAPARTPVELLVLPCLDASTSGHPVVVAILGNRLGLPLRWDSYRGGFWQIDRMPQLLPRRDAPQSEAIAKAVNAMRPAGTGPAYLLLAAGHRDLLIEARLPVEDEVRAASAKGFAFDAKAIALDAFVITVHRDNPVVSLTREQVRGIYTGAITSWKEVGGRDTPIHAYRRNPLSGSEELFRSLVLPGIPLEQLVAGKPMEIPTMSGLMNAVANDQDGIGYSVWFYQQKIDRRADVRLLAIDGVYPWHGSISDRSYPWTSEVWAVIRPDATPATVQLRDWLLAGEGQALIRDVGYAPIR